MAFEMKKNAVGSFGTRIEIQAGEHCVSPITEVQTRDLPATVEAPAGRLLYIRSRDGEEYLSFSLSLRTLGLRRPSKTRIATRLAERLGGKFDPPAPEAIQVLADAVRQAWDEEEPHILPAPVGACWKAVRLQSGGTLEQLLV